MKGKASNFPILFVGAGPGDPELITVRGRRALEEADLVVYAGSLVPAALLDWTRPACERVDSAGMHLEAIVECMVDGHAAGRRVVRLHTGDPSLYGAIAEQMEALHRRGIDCSVIPGVTAAFAAAAALGIEYTLPERTQTLILTRTAGRTPVPEAESLRALAAHRASMAIYLSIGMVDQVSEILVESYGASAPCAVVYRASQPDQLSIVTTTAALPARVREAGVTRQAVIIVGDALRGLQGEGAARSKLYDRSFAHGFRKPEDG